MHPGPGTEYGLAREPRDLLEAQQVVDACVARTIDP